MERLTKRREDNGIAYLGKVKDNEQTVDSEYPDTLKAIFESIQRLAAYEDTERTPEMINQMKIKAQELETELNELNCLAGKMSVMDLVAEIHSIHKRLQYVEIENSIIKSERDTAFKALELSIETHSINPRQVERLAEYYIQQAKVALGK